MMKFEKELENFAEKARAFCNWLEGEFANPLNELAKAERLLTEIHLAILSLPESNAIWEEVEDLANVESDTETEEALWEKCRNKLQNLPVDGYWEIFDASKIEDDKPVFALVSDDLSDVYRDLRKGLILYDQGMFAEAFWEWRLLFQIHWGNHLVGAQKAIRNYFSFKGEL